MAVIYIDGVKADCIAFTNEGDPYIVGIGTAYSELPVYSDENDILKIQFKFKNTDETTDNKTVIGSAFSGNGDYLLYMSVENGQPIYSYAVANNYTYIKAPRSTTDYDDIELGYDYMIVNGTTYTSQTPAKHSIHRPIYLFGGDTYKGSGVFGEVKIYKNDVLTYDLVPSLNSSGVACFKDVLNSDTEYLSAGKEYYYFKDGGSEPIVDTSKLLFKDGTFYNQDILKIGLYKGQVSGGELEFTGYHAGFLIEEINLPQGITSWNICFKLRVVTNRQKIQCGTCLPNLEASDLYGIIHTGANRITYNNNDLSANTNYYYGLSPAGSYSNSVFIGDAASGDHNMTYYIEEITMDLYDGPQIVRS